MTGRALPLADFGIDELELLDACAAAMLIIDASGNVIWANRHVERLLGTTAEHAAAQPIETWIHPREDLVQCLRELRSGGTVSFEGDTLLHTTAGDRWAAAHLAPLATGPVGAYLLQFVGIDDRMRALERLRRDEEVARYCVDFIDQAVVFVSQTLGVLRSNPAVGRIFECTADELFGGWCSSTWQVRDELAAPIARSQFAPFRAVTTGDAVRDDVNWIRHGAGPWRRVRISAYPFGWTDEVVITVTDITSYTAVGAPRPPDE